MLTVMRVVSHVDCHEGGLMLIAMRVVSYVDGMS